MCSRNAKFTSPSNKKIGLYKSKIFSFLFSSFLFSDLEKFTATPTASISAHRPDLAHSHVSM